MWAYLHASGDGSVHVEVESEEETQQDSVAVYGGAASERDEVVPGNEQWGVERAAC